MLYKYSYEIMSEQHFLHLPGLIAKSKTYLKLEGINLAGSIKLKTAVALVEEAERTGQLGPGGHIIESSSGSLGVALAMIAAAKDYKFTCVVDPNISRSSLAAIRALGARVIRVDRMDENGGYLQSRLEVVQRHVESDPEIVWLNQYGNRANPAAHAAGTATGILDQFPQVDYLFVGVGTAGTLMGCVERFTARSPQTRIVAVDAVGSVTFGGQAERRLVPGLGASRMPPLFESGCAYRQIQITEADTIRCCRMLARRYGYLAGGSTGSIVAAVLAMRYDIDAGSVVVALSPDMGDRYCDTIYDDDWVGSWYGPELIAQVIPDTADLSIICGLPATGEPCHCRRDSVDFDIVTGPASRRIIDNDRPGVIDTVRKTYLEHHMGASVNPPSYFLRFPGKPDARIIALPAYLADRNLAGIKWISSFPANVEKNLPRASSVLILNDYATGYPFACLESSAISAARTAASAVLVAEHIMGSRTAGRVLFVGAGVLGRTIADFLFGQQWAIASCLVFDLDEGSARNLAAHIGRNGVAATPVTDISTAVGRADLIVLATTAARPWMTDPAWLRPGQCILNISLRDLAPEVILSAHNIVDDIDHCLTANTSPHLAEQAAGHRRFIDGTAAQVILGDVKPEADRPRIFSPFGLGVLDLAVGEYVYQSASRAGLLTSVPDFFGRTERWER